MLIQSISTQPLTRATQPANRDGFLPSASYMRSGSLSIEADTPPDTVQLLDNTIAQQITTFLETATGTPKELESQFLASVLGQHLQEAKNIGETEAVKGKLLAYLQTDDLDGAFRLLNGSHQPLKHEFNGKYNVFKWMQNTMQAYVQEQPKHTGLPPELATFEAFEKHVKSLRRQVGLLLVQKAIKAMEATSQQLEAIKKKTTGLASLEHGAVLDPAITHHVQASPESAKMLEIHEVQQYLQGLLLSLGGGKSSIEEQLALKAVMADIPKDIRHVVQQFIDSEQQRLAEMKAVGANVQKQLAGQVVQTVEMIGSEVFNPAEISRQVNDFTTEMMPALQAEVVVPVVKLAEAVASTIQTTKDQVTKAISKATSSIGETVQSVVNPAKTGNGATTPAVVVKLPLPVSDGITFAKPLKVVEAQGEKVGWFPALIEQNKAWLPWAIGGTLSLGLLAWLGTRLSKKRPSVGEGEAS